VKEAKIMPRKKSKIKNRNEFLRFLKIVSISLIVGYFFELMMKSFWQYDKLTYFLGVPVGIVLAWTFLLTTGFYVIEYYESKTKIPYYLDLLFLYIPLVVIVEFIGTNVLNWQVNKIYPAIIGNFMKSPVVIYVAYYFVALFVYEKIFRITKNKKKKS